MKIRVMAPREIKDFEPDKEPDALAFLEKKRKGLPRGLVEGEKPLVSIHDCGHDEDKRCINWRRFEK